MAKNSKTNKKIRETLKALLANTGKLILIVAACSIVIAVIMNWENVIVELSRLVKVLMPFILGIVLAFLINPLVSNVYQLLNHFIFKDKRQKGCKYISVALSYLILLGILAVTIVYIVPQISESLKELTKSLGYGYNYVINNTAEIQQKYPFLPMEDIKQLLLKVVPDNIFGYGTDLAKFVFP